MEPMCWLQAEPPEINGPTTGTLDALQEDLFIESPKDYLLNIQREAVIMQYPTQ